MTRLLAGRSAGFTLVEVIVALSAGILVSAAAFALSKNATNFFQHEARIASAQLGVNFGMARLSTDLQRASFLSTRNYQTDPAVCRDGVANPPAGLTLMAGIQIQKTPSASANLPQSVANGFAPDEVVIGGSFDSSELFTVECVNSGAGGLTLNLATAQYDNAIARVLASLAATDTLTARMSTIFPVGRFVSIYDPASATRVFGVVSTAAVANGDVVSIGVQASAPNIPTKPGSACGLLQPPHCGKGWVVSAVSRVKYAIRQGAKLPAGSNYAAMVAPYQGAVTGDTTRTELVRVVLDANDVEDPTTVEVVSEYAVDLSFGLTQSKVVTPTNFNPTVTTYPLGDPNVYTAAGPVTAVGNRPELIRSVQARLVTRARAPDREAPMLTSPLAADGRRLHFDLGVAAPARYARLRTSYVNVSLPNQGGFTL